MKNHTPTWADSKATEIAERVVIDYANASGREDTMRPIIRESVRTHMLAALQDLEVQLKDTKRNIQHTGGASGYDEKAWLGVALRFLDLILQQQPTEEFWHSLISN